MKKTIIPIFLCLLFLWAPAGYAQWQIIPTGYDSELYAIDTYGDQTIALGTGKAIIVSQDGGDTWTLHEVDLGFGDLELSFPILDLHLIDEQSVVVTGELTFNNDQLIYRSVDNFATWDNTLDHSGGNATFHSFQDLEFITPQIGYAVGHPWNIVSTIDGGITWALKADITRPTFAISMYDEQHGIAVGDRNILVKTGDQNWREITRPEYLETVVMIDQQTAFAGGYPGMLKTIDGGNTWSEMPFAPKDVFNLLAVGPDLLLAGTTDGVYLSRSGGAYWEYFPETEGYEISGLAMANGVWWALDKSGKLLRSADLSGAKPLISYGEIHPEELPCGTTTVELTNNGSPEWSYEWYLEGELFSTDYNASLTFEESGGQQVDLVAITPNGRDTFVNTVYQAIGVIPKVEIEREYTGCTGNVYLLQMDQPLNKRIYDYEWYIEGESEPFTIDTFAQVNFTEDQRVLLVAANDECRDTTFLNFDVTQEHIPRVWEEIEAPDSEARLFDIYFVDDERGYAVSWSGFFRTLDGGKTWEKKADFAAESISFANPMTAYVIRNRELWKTMDGGESFFRVPRNFITLSASTLLGSKVHFVNDTLGFLIDNNNTGSDLSRSVDGGKTWEEVPVNFGSGSISRISAVTCKEATCLLSNDGFGLYRSVDFGRSWNRIEQFDHWATSAVILDDSTYILNSEMTGNIPTSPRPAVIRRTTDEGQNWAFDLLGVTDRHIINNNIKERNASYLFKVNENTLYLWDYPELFSSVDGGQCWRMENAPDIDNEGIFFTSEEIGYLVGDGGSFNPSRMFKTRPEVYFTIPYPRCIGNTVQFSNESVEKDYDQFEWYRNGELFSTDPHAQWSINDPGTYIFTLMAHRAGEIDSFTREVVIDPVPSPLEWIDDPGAFCATPDTIRVTNLGDRYGYQWKLNPESDGYWFADRNELEINWRAGSQSTPKISVFGISENLCTTDTLELSLPVQQRLRELVYAPGNPTQVCILPGEQQTLHFGLPESIIPWGTYDWRLIDAPDDWTLTPAGNGVDLRGSAVDAYRRIGLEVQGETSCFSLTDTTYLDIIGPPEIIAAPHDLLLFEGDDIVLEMEVRETPGVELRYRLYKDSYLLASSPYPKMVFQNFNAAEDEGTYYMEVDNGCQVARTEPFVIALSNHARFTVFYDRNEDGIQTLPGEPGIGSGQFVIGEDQIAFPSTIGQLDYYPEDGLGMQTITYQPAPDWKLTAETDTYELDLDLEAPQLFKLGVSPVETIDRIEGFLTSDPLVCNLRTQFYLTVKNTGTTLQNVNLEINAPQIGYRINQGVSGLWPGETLNRIINIPMQGVELIGDTINFVLTYSYTKSGGSGETISDEYLYQDVLLCAYDPNDKQVMPAGEGEERATRFGEALHYTVRFQNTGNYPARDIRIRDTLDENLDLATFELLSTSHTLSRLVMEDRALEFIFKDIYLPDSTNNEPGSHGYLSYRIQPRADLPEFTSIENTAHIYFDQNPPIVTNTTQNTLTDGLVDAVVRPEASPMSVRIYPNPSRGELVIETDAVFPDRLPWRLCSPTGQIVGGGQLQSRKEQLSFQVPSGVYWLNVGSVWRKVVFF